MAQGGARCCAERTTGALPPPKGGNDWDGELEMPATHLRNAELYGEDPSPPFGRVADQDCDKQSHDPMRGCRIGEASHPGPSSRATVWSGRSRSTKWSSAPSNRPKPSLGEDRPAEASRQQAASSTGRSIRRRSVENYAGSSKTGGATTWGDLETPSPAVEDKEAKMGRPLGPPRNFCAWQCPHCDFALKHTGGDNKARQHISRGRMRYRRMYHPTMEGRAKRKRSLPTISFGKLAPTDSKMWECPLCKGYITLSEGSRFTEAAMNLPRRQHRLQKHPDTEINVYTGMQLKARWKKQAHRKSANRAAIYNAGQEKGREPPCGYLRRPPTRTRGHRCQSPSGFMGRVGRPRGTTSPWRPSTSEAASQRS